MGRVKPGILIVLKVEYVRTYGMLLLLSCTASMLPKLFAVTGEGMLLCVVASVSTVHEYTWWLILCFCNSLPPSLSVHACSCSWVTVVAVFCSHVHVLLLLSVTNNKNSPVRMSKVMCGPAAAQLIGLRHDNTGGREREREREREKRKQQWRPSHHVRIAFPPIL